MSWFQYTLDKKEYLQMFVWICHLIICILSILVTLLVLVWGVYYACRVREFGKKVHYLKKQTDERWEELTNARVEYTKSVFLTVICLTEVLGFAFAAFSLSLHVRIPHPVPVKTGECSGNNWVYKIKGELSSRLPIAVAVSGLLVYTSLIHILTSYMANVYSEKRVVKLSRREKLLLLLLFTQLAVVWLSVFNWRAILFVMLLSAVTIFPIHTFFFVKFSRQLYTALKRRTLDAWFEDTEQHKKLKGMCHEYKWGAIMYGVSMVLMGLTLSFMGIAPFIRMVLKNKCWLNKLLGIKEEFDWLNTVHEQNNVTFQMLERMNYISHNLLAISDLLLLLILNAYILFGAVKRLVKRRRAYNSYTGTRQIELNRPLIGNK